MAHTYIQLVEFVIKKDNKLYSIHYTQKYRPSPPRSPLRCQLLDLGKACFHSVLTYILDRNDQTLTKPHLEQASVLMSHKIMLYPVKN